MNLYLPIPLITFIAGYLLGAATTLAFGAYLYHRGKRRVAEGEQLSRSMARQIGQE